MIELVYEIRIENNSYFLSFLSALSWLRENNIVEKTDYEFMMLSKYTIFYFNKQEDAILFSLTFGEYVIL